MAGQPPGDGPPPPPRHAAPAGHAGRGDNVGPPHPHTRAHSTWVADPNIPPSGRAVGGGTAPGLRRPPQWWEAPPPGTPSRHPHSEQRKGARCGAGAGSPHPHRPHPGHTGRETLAARSRGRAVGGGTAPDLRRPSPWWKAPPLGDALPPPPQRATPARKGTRCGAGAGPPHPHRPRPGHVGHRTLAARSRGRAAGGGTAPNTRRPSQCWKAPSPGTPIRQPSRGEPGPDRPPPSTPDRARDRGRTRGGARTTWNGPTSAQCRDHARCARHTTQGGGGADTARARAHTHERDTRGLPEGQPDRARGTHRPRGMAYQRARVRDTRTGRPATRSAEHAGRGGGNERDTTPGTGPNPPNRPRAPRTHRRGTAPAKAVVAHSATPQPLG